MMQYYGLLGKKLGHSLSPVIHKKLFAYSGVQAEFKLYECESAEAFMPIARTLQGYAVTIPYKEEIYRMLEVCDESATRFASVNIVKSDPLCGYNTDCVGFMRSVKELRGTFDGKVLLLGAGGVGRMIATLYRNAELTVALRNPDDVRYRALGESLPRAAFVSFDNIADVSYDLIVNATPVGMYPDSKSCPVCERLITKAKAVYDTIYNPQNTQLKRVADCAGVPAKTGMDMLVYQAAQAHAIWYGANFTDEQLKETVAAADRELELICGLR